VAPGDHSSRPAVGLPPTGDDRVDAAVGGLGRLAGRPADEHVAVLEEVHGRLRDILGELNEGSP
jgi:isocitrate dehydrogenase